MRNQLVILIVFVILLGTSACQKSTNVNSTPPSSNASPLPPGFSQSPLPPGATPTPGIPDVNAPKTNNQPKGTPTPGIPDMDSLKRGKTPPLNEKTTPSKGPTSPGQMNKRRL